MLLEGYKPNDVTCMSILRGYTNLSELDGGRYVHDLILQIKLKNNVCVSSTLVDMYSKCGSLHDACSVFYKMPSHNVVSYSALIAGHVQAGQVAEALMVFECMREEKIEPDEVTFVHILKGVALMGALEEGIKIHALIKKSGHETNKYVGCALIDMYAKCRSMNDAQNAFNLLKEKDVVLWTTMIDVYGELGYADEALSCYQNMQIQGLRPASYTFVSILKACSSLATISTGRYFHNQIIEIEEYDFAVVTALINMYMSTGSIREAEGVFHKFPKENASPWNAMISGLVQYGFTDKALVLYNRMQIECIQPNVVTFTSVLKGCSTTSAIKQFHVHIIMLGLEFEVMVLNALIHLYAKFGELIIAWILFDKLPSKNETSWNGLIAAFVQNRNYTEALNLFIQMTNECILPDMHAFTNIFNACCNGTLLSQGCRFHLMLQSKYYDPPLYTSLIEMYAKCGKIEAAREIFSNMVERSIAAWNVMIMGYAQHGMPRETLDLFREMQECNIHTSQVSLAGVLSACSHAGLVNEGELCFISSYHQYGITLSEEHMVCLIGLLSRAGQVEKGEVVLEEVSPELRISGLKALHSAHIDHMAS
ncbi:hypothetical protein KP509_29G048500 [Ceratopteris richardii]|nr:hypothetical protein KP509_29G048500 [Ceratopteris richardii]